MTAPYPQRLIEVDLPIKRISAHARREKDMRLGHIPSLHIYPAARPLAACRAVICASLWPDPADPLCPLTFRRAAADAMIAFARGVMADSKATATCDPESWKRYGELAKRQTPLDLTTLPIPRRNGDPPPATLTDLELLRTMLLDFIADFAAWEASTQKLFLSTARTLTQAAHESLGGTPGTRPLVVDPFAGGGSIPLEALRVGADAFASDLNPVAVLLNKVVLEYIPKYGQQLADEVRKWGQWVKERAEKELAEYYPKDPDGATPIAYLWARTIQCEGPNCGAEVPLMRSLWLAKKGQRSVALKLVPKRTEKRVDFEIIRNVKASDVGGGTVARGSATCPCCGYTTPVASVRVQLKARKGGAADARLFAVVTTRADQQGRFYRLPNDRDLQASTAAAKELDKRRKEHNGPLPLVPEELTPRGGGSGAGRAFSQRHYGMEQWCDLFTPRQLLTLTTYASLTREYAARIPERSFATACNACLGLLIDRLADLNAALCVWQLSTPNTAHVFGRWAIQMNWDFGEANPLAGAGGSPESAIGRMARSIVDLASAHLKDGQVEWISADNHTLPDDVASAIVTDPPYYDAVPYADLSDFFYVWLKRTLPTSLEGTFHGELTPKTNECIVDEVKGKDRAYFERTMAAAMAEGRRILRPDGIGLIVFAHKSTSGWEAQLQAMVDAGWIITGSWPIDTEMGSRLRAKNSAALASSVHLVCRPRENGDGSVRTDAIGDWRTVLQELPERIHQWMPRLEAEGVVGADAIFACLGPALEIFSRYSRVEKANGETVTLREYLEHVWAAVAQEALRLVFDGADAGALEADARLTAIWLWTMGANGDQPTDNSGEDDNGVAAAGDDGEDGTGKAAAAKTGYTLEYDAARKIAQGLGANLEQLADVVEVKGDKARLLAVAERTRILFGKNEGQVPRKARKKARQANLFASIDELENEDGGWGDKSVPKLGNTVLDRVHQSMILFAAGRGEAVKRFLVEEGAGRDGKFWKLAQSLSALYPVGTDEKRWVDGVLARKKGLGL